MTKAEFFRDARNDLSGPLAGIRVVEATTTAAGPLCSAMLADLGADVIKVETPQGDVTRRLPPLLPGTKVSFAHGTINRNKRSLSLDLRRHEGCEIFLKLTAKADIVVENFKAGTMDEWASAIRPSARSSSTSFMCRLPDGANSVHIPTIPVTTRLHKLYLASCR
jgi:formyl-CoA transferase